MIEASHFEVYKLTADLYQVVYESQRLDEEGTPTHRARRSSLWRKAEASWKMLFHQGTFV